MKKKLNRVRNFTIIHRVLDEVIDLVTEITMHLGYHYKVTYRSFF